MVCHPLKKINDMNSWCVIIFHFIATAHHIDKPINRKAMYASPYIYLKIKSLSWKFFSNGNAWRISKHFNIENFNQNPSYWNNIRSFLGSFPYCSWSFVLEHSLKTINIHLLRNFFSFVDTKFNRKLLPFCLAIYVSVCACVYVSLHNKILLEGFYWLYWKCCESILLWTFTTAKVEYFVFEMHVYY